MTEPTARRSLLPQSRRARVITAIVAVLALVALSIGGFIFVKAQRVTRDVFQGGGGAAGLLGSGAPLAKDANGRTNVVIFGTSQDDPAHAQGDMGMWLTDSIQVISLDEKTKTATMIAIPRDLWVTIDTPCVVGAHSKINAVYECGAGLTSQKQSELSDYTQRDQRGAKALVAKLEQVTGLKLQYYLHVDYTVLREATDAIGGIDVNIEGDGADGIYDTNQDQWHCKSGAVSCRAVYYPHDGVYHLTGTQALALARARGDANPNSAKNFGLARGDFDRAINQQKIMVAIIDKATTAGVLANPMRVSQLLDALGSHVTTNMSTDEAKTLIDFLRTNIKAGAGINKAKPSSTSAPSTTPSTTATTTATKKSITSFSLTDPNHPLLDTAMIGQISVVLPTAGQDDYSQIHTAIAAELAKR